MTSYDWLNDYVGIPYKWGGRDERGLDCYGLVSLIYKQRFNVQLPDWKRDQIDLRGHMEDIESVVCSGDFDPLSFPDDGCFVICYRKRAAHHIGLYFNGGVIHAANEKTRVVYEPLGRFLKNYNHVEYGSWTP